METLPSANAGMVVEQAVASCGATIFKVRDCFSAEFMVLKEVFQKGINV